MECKTSKMPAKQENKNKNERRCSDIKETPRNLYKDKDGWSRATGLTQNYKRRLPQWQKEVYSNLPGSLQTEYKTGEGEAEQRAFLETYAKYIKRMRQLEFEIRRQVRHRRNGPTALGNVVCKLRIRRKPRKNKKTNHEPNTAGLQMYNSFRKMVVTELGNKLEAKDGGINQLCRDIWRKLTIQHRNPMDLPEKDLRAHVKREIASRKEKKQVIRKTFQHNATALQAALQRQRDGVLPK